MNAHVPAPQGADAGHRYRIDKFTVPAAAHDAFIERIRFIDGFLHGQPGCLQHGLYEWRLDDGDYGVVTLVQWESEAAMAAAKARAAEEYRRQDFNPGTFLAQWGIRADMGSYMRLG
ncbi:antibiotic biosynthesis monooxygenase [Nitrospirillum sp. BR 11163]|uniref:antibiotic biosynthesis monooxygenase n=1 Tax=Nitrospirillum sp. BR 11163 TaxID=3104323 RepID=UPI002AFFBE64|nr:antibiotic biosynthesis monooxygenase [Nitrospirillum sp. BR 11163]MEA1673440.1 antibiotic biosynthesis monooxygenase [Nitrospirillum sp. BR 11163]